MNQLVFSASLFAYMQHGLFTESSVESCAILLMNRAAHERSIRFLVREVVIAPPEAYLNRTNRYAQLKSTFVAELVRRARVHNMCICFVHTHVGDAEAYFSDTDNAGEQALLPFLERRTRTSDHVSLVVTKSRMNARMIGTQDSVVIRSVGSSVFISNSEHEGLALDRYDRQVRAFGSDGQRLLAEQTVCIVGLGGTGSIMAQSLAYLGVNKFLLLDFDTVSQSNLNRLVGATFEDIGRLKVEVAASNIRRIQPEATVHVVTGDVTERRVNQQLRNVDFIFGCTDSHGSRAVLNQFAYQYLTPVIDMGVSIVAEGEKVKRITGRVQMLSPGLGCLVCGSQLNYDQVRWDFMGEQERAADPYFIGHGEPAPSVISVNSTVASLAVTMFLSAVAGVPSNARLQIYDGIKGTLRVATIPPTAGCIVCSSFGTLAQGDSGMLLGREVVR